MVIRHGPTCTFKVNNFIGLKWFRYWPDLAQRVGRGIALLFHDRSTRRGWVVSSTPRPHFTSEKDPVPILQEAGWAPGPVWTGGKSCPHQGSIPDRPALVSRHTDRATRPTVLLGTNIYVAFDTWRNIQNFNYLKKIKILLSFYNGGLIKTQ